MYICICKAIREREVDAAVRAGARRPSDVFRACGKSPVACYARDHSARVAHCKVPFKIIMHGWLLMLHHATLQLHRNTRSQTLFQNRQARSNRGVHTYSTA